MQLRCCSVCRVQGTGHRHVSCTDRRNVIVQHACKQLTRRHSRRWQQNITKGHTWCWESSVYRLIVALYSWMGVAVDAQTTRTTTTASVNKVCQGVSAHNEHSTQVGSYPDTVQAKCQNKAVNQVTNKQQANNSIQASINWTQRCKHTMWYQGRCGMSGTWLMWLIVFLVLVVMCWQLMMAAVVAWP